ncbi:putative holin-like toxin [Agrilactobacillus yilanensis]|uniref:Holin-like toxin n=1 Tax=Agrilactobacillus yilanensis TaxID=2485997 RepID=A0ABW4J5T4_9LACO
MSVTDALQLMIAFGAYTIALITLVVALINKNQHKK